MLCTYEGMPSKHHQEHANLQLQYSIWICRQTCMVTQEWWLVLTAGDFPLSMSLWVQHGPSRCITPHTKTPEGESRSSGYVNHPDSTYKWKQYSCYQGFYVIHEEHKYGFLGDLGSTQFWKGQRSLHNTLPCYCLCYLQDYGYNINLT